MKLIIIGNGIAGVHTCEIVRRYSDEIEIDLLTDEKYGYYSRVWLPQLISGEKTADQIIMHDAEWFASKNIEYHQETRVNEIYPGTKQVILESGDTYSYDILCICTGASCNVPPFKNVDTKGVFTLRTIDDALAIKAYIEGKENAVCIGGGLLGLETARNVEKAGIDTTIVEILPRLLPRQMCSTSATILEEKINSLGIKTITGANVDEILGLDQVTGVKLVDGTVLKADVVLISSGITPRLETFQNAGLTINKGLVVNEFMQTSDASIYAAGDIIEFNNRGWGIIPAAIDQAEVAGKMIAGVSCDPYMPTVPSNKLKIMDFDVMAVGSMILDDEDDECKVFISKDDFQGVYKKFVMREGKLIGSILIAAKDDEQFVAQNINKEIPEEDIQARLAIDNANVEQEEQ
ncbi:MAG TPA: FAD-dependent oxidoreductase [Candidatus Lokiarchaeia archaeon]|nr:FAD-dependent oxidoreductase [Candidatus Lokiarchaeia archaeon]